EAEQGPLTRRAEPVIGRRFAPTRWRATLSLLEGVYARVRRAMGRGYLRPVRRIDPRRLCHQSFESPRQHLAHHAEVIARRQILRPDVELAILVLAKALRPRDDHGA